MGSHILDMVAVSLAWASYADAAYSAAEVVSPTDNEAKTLPYLTVVKGLVGVWEGHAHHAYGTAHPIL